MYYVLSALAIVSGVFYTAFGDSDRQFWDDGPRNKFGYTNGIVLKFISLIN